MEQKVPVSPTKWLRILYIIALSMIAILAITGQWLIQRTLASIEQDARIVNVAGRQRMLSQRISRTVLEISLLHGEDTAPNANRLLEKRETLKVDLEDWSRSHDRLRLGSGDSNLVKSKSKSIEAAFLEIDEDYGIVRQAAQHLVDNQDSAIDPHDVVRRSDRFLSGMDRIVGLYESEARERVSQLEGMERLLLLVTLSVLVCEGLFIFTPAIRSLQRSFDRLEKTREELFAAKEQADMANRAKSDFLTRVSHELRTPLHAIAGMLGLTRGRSLSESNRRRIRIAKQATRHLHRLVDDLLDVSAIESGSVLQVRNEPVAIRSLIDSVAALMQPAAHKKGLSFQCGMQDDLPKVCLLDRMRTQQILLNLLQNAIRYTNSGFVRLECRFIPSNSASMDSDPSGVIAVRVSDSGIGISTENQQRIFQAFETIEEDPYKAAAAGSSSELGTSLGLGLSVVSSLIEALGGKVGLESEIGKGTTIDVQLPTVCVSPKTRDNPSLSANILAHTNRRNTLSAYILDDAKPNRVLMRSYLKRLEFSCQSFSSIDPFLDSCRRNPPDWVFIDWQLPGMGGLQLLAELRSISRQIKVVVVTADILAFDAIQQRAQRVEGCFLKPLEFTRFKREMERIKNFSISPRKDEVDKETEDTPAARDSLTIDEHRDLLSLERKLQRLVLEQFAVDCEEMKQSIRDRDRSRLQLIAHRVRGSAGNARLGELAEKMRQLEEAALNEELEAIGDLLAQVETACRASSSAIPAPPRDSSSIETMNNEAKCRKGNQL